MHEIGPGEPLAIKEEEAPKAAGRGRCPWRQGPKSTCRKPDFMPPRSSPPPANAKGAIILIFKIFLNNGFYFNFYFNILEAQARAAAKKSAKADKSAVSAAADDSFIDVDENG